MATDKQIDANRRNARRSTSPTRLFYNLRATYRPLTRIESQLYQNMAAAPEPYSELDPHPNGPKSPPDPLFARAFLRDTSYGYNTFTSLSRYVMQHA